MSRGWSRAELARALHRDPTKLYSDSGNPKLDFLVALAEALEWPVGEVVASVWGEDGSSRLNGEATIDDFQSLDALTMDAHRAGDYSKMVDLSRRLFSIADSPERRALACNREAGGWDGLGRYTKALDAVRRGLQQGQISTELRLKLQGNLANAYYTLWDLTSAMGVAEMLVQWHRENPPDSPLRAQRAAFARYVRGNAHRRLMDIEEERADMHARMARVDLEASMHEYDRLAVELDDEALAGIANTCRAGIIEVDVELGAISPARAIEELSAGLDNVIDLDAIGVGDWLESYGWWCIFGGNIALRHLHGRQLQHALAVFTNKALEIADRLDNWAMRERVFSLQYALHEAMIMATDFEIDFTIDDEDRRLIAGTMGRFPRFRGVGWKILRTAKLVAAS
ncbi:MAG: hypothetical protein EA376_04035 [Phycisphaeraceae bacterium]|nr:MAG: hypothetical protein EA376_04035 [Phycisphaeraceae bacterium]